ncbi:MAG: AsmA-like C-terminal region-containing protein [Bacteroidales bacterium]
MKISKVIKAIAITAGSLLLIMVAIPFAFSGKIVTQAGAIINSSIRGEVKYSEPKLTFFSRFPVLTLTVKDLSISGVPGFEKDTLIKGEELSFGVDLFSVFGDNIIIDRIYGNGVELNVVMKSDGTANFDLLPESSPETDKTSDEPGALTLSVKKISFKNSKLTFYEESMNLTANVLVFNMDGTVSAIDSTYEIKSVLNSESLTVGYDGVNYIDKKTLNSDLVLKIENDMSLFSFDGSRIKLDNLEALLSGVFELPEKGYNVDINLKSAKSNFKDIVSTIPADIIKVGNDFELNGTASFDVNIKDSDSLEKEKGIFVSMSVEDGFIKAAAAPSPVTGLNVKGDFAMPSFSLSAATLNLNSISFSLNDKKSSANLNIKGFDKPEIKSEFNGELDLNLLTQALALEGFKFEGDLSFNGMVDGTYDSEKGTIPVTNILISLDKGSLTTPYISEPLKDINAKVAIKSPKGSQQDLYVEIAPLEFNFSDGPFYLDCKLENFNNLRYNISSKGVANLDKIWELLGIDSAFVKGVFTADFSIKGDGIPSDLKNYDKTEGSGTLGLKNFEYKSDGYKYPFRIPKSTFQFEKERAILRNTRLEYGSNIISVDGYASDFVNYYLSKGVMKGSLSVSSDKINLADFIALIPQSDSLSKPSEGVILIPERLNLFLKADVKRVDFESLTAKNFSGEVAISDKTFFINGTGVNIAGARFLLDAVYKPVNERLADVQLHARADSFDIGRAYKEIPMIRELFTTAKNMDGIISMDYKITAKLNASMLPLYPSVKGEGFVRLENVNIKGLKVLGAISRATGKDSLENPNLKAVLIKTKIENNIMKIERTKMRILGFRPRFEGETSLDGKLNLNFRLGLPPFGLVGIPLTITGTFDNPVVEVRRGKEGDKLEEEEYDDEAVEETKKEEKIEKNRVPGSK